MSAQYPSAVKTYTTKVDGPGNTILAAHVNELQDEITALEQALLTNGLAHDLKFIDAAYDIGKNGATRPRDGFFSRNFVIGGTLGVTGIATFTAQDVHSAGLSSADDIVFSADKVIRRNTSDGSDNGFVTLNGGGGLDETRGGWISVSGNERGSSRPGFVEIQAGNVANSQIILRRGDGTGSLNILGADGSATFTSSLFNAWVFNNTSVNGGYITFQRSGVGKGRIGQSISASGGNDLEVIADGGHLYLTSAANQVRSTTVAADITASAANVFIVSATGEIQRSTSSARYKKNITSISLRESRRVVGALQGVLFVERSTGIRHAGLIAERTARVTPRLVTRDAKGRPDAVQYGHGWVYALPMLTDHEARLARIEKRLRKVAA